MASGFPDYTPRVFTSATNFEQLRIAAGAVEATNSFTQQIKSIFIYNDGPHTCYLNFDAVSTVLLVPILSRSWVFLDLQFTDLHTICAAGQTATLNCVGFY
jgi:hypothetical protein